MEEAPMMQETSDLQTVIERLEKLEKLNRRNELAGADNPLGENWCSVGAR
jgi:hypothetical protein